MKRKRKLLLLVAVSLLVLAGWGQKKVELLNDKKLIDLSAAIGKCLIGAEELTKDEGDNTKDPENPTVTPAANPSPTVTPKVTPKITVTSAPTRVPLPRTIEIRIRDQKVIYNYVEWPALAILTEQLQKDHDERTTFRLIDDYAEAHVFRQMLGILEELENEIGLNFTREQEDANE